MQPCQKIGIKKWPWTHAKSFDFAETTMKPLRMYRLLVLRTWIEELSFIIVTQPLILQNVPPSLKMWPGSPPWYKHLPLGLTKTCAECCFERWLHAAVSRLLGPDLGSIHLNQKELFTGCCCTHRGVGLNSPLSPSFLGLYNNSVPRDKYSFLLLQTLYKLSLA